MRLTKEEVKRREALAYRMFALSPPDAEEPTEPCSVKSVQDELRKPENGGRMMSPGRIYQIHRAAKAREPLPPPNDFSKKVKF